MPEQPPEPGSFVDHDAPTLKGASAGADDHAAVPGRPGQIGPFTISETLGEGGMGVVYLAEQSEPIKRRVALKVIKRGMDTDEIITRFQAEQQALALMDHSNVARVFDAGVTDDGRPYFVMEHVPGEPITAHCDAHELSIRQRIDLFMLVCEAVQHAHQKGIIHRDLKPSNILVAMQDGQAVPKVIDFGIAKAVHENLTEQTVFTQHGQLVGTPEYMSPEQAGLSGQDVDTRSDIYALGVLLYELVTGARPFESKTLRDAGMAEIQRIICDVDPPRPSNRLGSLAASSASQAATRIARMRGTELRALTGVLRSDLDWVVMKCLEKDRERRYETAGLLVMELQRFLDDEPVLAGPPSISYRFGKFARRNRGAVIAGITIAGALVIATGVSIAFGVKAERARASIALALGERDAALAAETLQRERAQEREREADAARAGEALRARELEQVVQFQEAQISAVDPDGMGLAMRDGLRAKLAGAGTRRGLSPEESAGMLAAYDGMIEGADFTGLALETLDREIFAPSLAAIDRNFQSQPLVRARLLQSIAFTMVAAGLLDGALGPQIEALELRRDQLGNEHPHTLDSISAMGILLHERGAYDEAMAYCVEALDGRRARLGDDDAATIRSLRHMGTLLQAQGRLGEAEPFLREALERRSAALGENHPFTITAIDGIGGLLHAQGQLDEAAVFYRRAIESSRRTLGDDHRDTVTTIGNLGLLLQEQGRLDAALPLLLEALETRRRTLGSDHPDTLVSVNNMGILMNARGEPEAARPYFQETLDSRRRTLGSNHPETVTSVANLAALLKAEQRYEEADPLFREVLAARRQTLGDSHPMTIVAIHNMGSLEFDQGNLYEADLLCAEAVHQGRKGLPEGHWYLGIFLVKHAQVLAASGDFAGSAQRALEAHELLDTTLGAAHTRTIDAVEQLVETYDTWHAAEPDAGHDDAAAAWRLKLASPGA